MLWVLASLLTTARAGVTEGDLSRILRELRPEVESITGHGMGSVPPAVIDDRAHVVQILVARKVAASPPGADAAAIERTVQASLDEALAVYDATDHRMYFLSDAFRALLTEGDASSRDVEPLVRCVAAHELAHAVQAHSVHRTGPPLPDDVLAALHEGHANLVEEEACPSGMSELARLSSGREFVPGAASAGPGVFPYAYGTAFVRAWQAHHGRDATWDLLERAAPTRADVERVVDALVPAQWRDTRALQQLVLRFHVGPATGREATPISGRSVFVGLADGSPAPTPDVVTALWAQLEGDEGRSGLVVLSVTDPKVAARWVSARADRWIGPAASLRVPIAVPPVVTRTAKTPPALARLPGVDTLATLHATTRDGHYEEVWALSGSVLAGGWRTAATDGRDTVARAVVEAATRYAATPAGVETPEIATILDRLRP